MEKSLTAAEMDFRRFPVVWPKVEDFLREYGRELARASDYASVAARMSGRGQGLRVRGPLVFLEMLGVERRVGVVGNGDGAISLLGGRQRLLMVSCRGDGVACRHMRFAEDGIKTDEVVLALAEGTRERQRLERLMEEAIEVDGGSAAHGESWEEPARRLRLALDMVLELARAGRRMVDEAGKRDTRHAQAFQRAIGEIAARHAEDLKVETVAAATGMSVRHFARLLQHWSGSGFTEHLLMVRLMRARHQLALGNRAIVEVGGEVGFASRDHFIRAFRQYFGWTPLQFRKKWRRAAEGLEPWEPVLRMPGRAEVEWLAVDGQGRPDAPEAGKFHTLVIANASRDVRLLQRLEPDGAAVPQGALLPGQSVFHHQDGHGSHWRALDARGAVVGCFRTPPARAIAVIPEPA